MKTVKKVLALLVILSLVLTFAACGGGGAKGMDLLNVCISSEPQTIDPALNSSVDGAIMANHMFEGLMKWKDDGKGNGVITEGQAASYKVSDDGLVYTFTLRDNIKWSDGKPVVAGDFVYAWQRLVDPATAADYSYMLDPVVNATAIISGEKAPTELGVKALDDKTLEVTLVAATPFFTEICAFPATFPVRKDIIDAKGDQWTFDVATYIGNGPYKMSEWVHNSYIKIVKNENYYDPNFAVPTAIQFTLMDDDNAIYAAFNSGELQFINTVPNDEVATLLEQKKLNVVDNIGTYYVTFNNSKAPFNDVRVRQAFSLTIDRNYIVEQITKTGQIPAGGYVPSGILDAAGTSGDDFRTVGGDFYDLAKDKYQANCDKARQLLADAGYPGGQGFPIVEYLYNTSSGHKAIAEALQNMWQKELGVTVTLANQDWAVFLQTRKQGDYQIARNGWIADYNDPMTFLDMWVTGSGNNDAQYSNKRYDDLIAQAKATSVQKDRMKLMHDAEQILLGEDWFSAPLYFYTNSYMIDSKVKGMYYVPLGYYFFNTCHY